MNKKRVIKKEEKIQRHLAINQKSTAFLFIIEGFIISV